MKKILEMEIAKLERLQTRLMREQDRIRERTEAGKLICKKRNESFQYYFDGKYISKKKDGKRLKEMASIEYRHNLLTVLKHEIWTLKRALCSEEKLADVYRNMHKGKQILFRPDYVPVEMKIKEFEAVQYEGLGFREGDPTDFITGKGERVRSKSEKIIADELARQGIPYKYEKPLPLNVDGMVRDFYPDFTVMNIATGEIKYLEHLGMLDNSNYLKNTLSKLDIYEKNGLLIGREVILLHESSYRPLNTRVITDYIREFLT